MRRSSFIAGLAVLSTLVGWQVEGAAATDAPGTALRLGDCVRMAIENGPDRDLIAADLAAAKARLEEARAGKFGDAQYTQLLGVINEAEGDAVFSPNSQTDFFDGLGPFTRLELDIRIPLYTFGKLSAALDAAEQGMRSESARGEMVRADTVLETKRLYYGLQLSEQLADLLREMLDSMDEAIEKTQKRLDDGSQTVTERDVLRLQIGRSRFAAGVEEVDASTRLTRSALARAVGLDPGERIEIAERRMEMAEVELEPIDVYEAAGPHRRPEWKRLVSGIDAQQARVELEEASAYPTLFLATGVRYAVAGNRDDQKNPFVYDDYNFVEPVGVLGIHWDLNVFANRAKAAQARAEMDKMLAERRRAETGLRLEVERSYVEVERARATVESVRAGRKAARGLMVLTVANFDLGIGEGDELFEAYGAYTETSTDYFRAVHDYNVSLAELSRAVGEELLDLEY